MTYPRLGMLKPSMTQGPNWIESRINRHGTLYILEREARGLVEARSLATGVLCTFTVFDFEDDPHAIQKPE